MHINFESFCGIVRKNILNHDFFIKYDVLNFLFHFLMYTDGITKNEFSQSVLI